MRVELRTVRDAMRELNRMVERLERGESEKFVLTKHGQMRAFVISVDRFATLRTAFPRQASRRLPSPAGGRGSTAREWRAVPLRVLQDSDRTTDEGQASRPKKPRLLFQ